MPHDGGTRVTVLRTPAWVGRSAAAVLGVLALAACDPGPADGAVSGTVVSVSDVSNLPDVPDPGGWVVAFPGDRIPEVLELAGEDLTADDLPYSWFALSVEAAQRLGGTVGEVDGAGRFRLTGSGDVLLCRLVADRATDVRGVRGCVRTVLPTDEELRVTTGEAGLRVASPEG